MANVLGLNAFGGFLLNLLDLICWRKVFITVAAIAVFGSASAFAGESELHATLAVNQEYTDNVFEERDDRKSDFITRLMPGVALKYKAPRWDWDAAYNLDYRYYAKGTHGNETTHGANVKGLVTVVENLLYLDVSDTYKRVSLDVARDRTQGSLFANQSDQNVLNASPYFVWRTGTRGTLKTGYRYTNTWYREPEAIDKQTHIGFVDWSMELSPKMVATAGYDYTIQKSTGIDPRWHNVGTSLRYEYVAGSDISGQFGNRWTEYEDGLRSSDMFWGAGINHKVNNVMLRLKTEQSFQEDPATQSFTRKTSHSGGVDAEFDRGQVGFTGSYSRYVRGDDSGITSAISLPQKDRVYQGALRGRYSLTPHVAASAGVSGENFFTHYMYDSPRRIIGDGALSYMKDTFTVMLSYRYLASFSKNEVDDNYRVNRFMLEVRKVF